MTLLCGVTVGDVEKCPDPKSSCVVGVELASAFCRQHNETLTIRHMNDLFVYDDRPGNDNFRHTTYRQYVLR